MNRKAPALRAPVLLVVEDDPSLRELLEQNLRFEGYRVEVASNGKQGLEAVEIHQPDLILLDLMLPVMSGLEVCKRLRGTGNEVPIIMLTARDTQVDKIRGLKIGADDYVSKPFDLMELLARIEAVLRRTQQPGRYQEEMQVGNIRVHFGEQMLHNGTAQIPLTRQECLLLQYLMHQAGQVCAREQIMADVWGHDELFSYRTIDTHITRLRQKIEINPSQPRHLLTVHRVGYRFQF
ncbi:MAG: response regulator transcription factor [Bacteroidota bacterium]